MSNTNTGGPAFPDGSTNEWGNAYNGGMTLRDYFAAKAMQAYLADRAWQAEIPHSETARVAYIVADAMLKARET
jgi:hypothetical protein